MKILKLLSSFFFVFLVCNPINNIKANEPVDIWNIEKKEIPEDQSIICLLYTSPSPRDDT